MKSKRNSLMCITLAFIVLFLGMCSQVKRADSILANFQQMESEADSALTSRQQSALEADFIDKGEVDSSYIGNCTNKLITGLRDTFQNIRRGQGKLGLKINGEFLCAKEILHLFLSFSIVIIVACDQIQGSDIIILNYIHNQDGEK